MNEAAGRVYYVYGFARTGLGSCPRAPNSCEAANDTLPCAGVDESDRPCLWPNFGGVAAIVSTVKRDDFCGPTGDANLANLAWMAPRVIRHQKVLEVAMRLGPIIPARFGTLFSSKENLTAFLEKHATTISEFLSRMEDSQEWGVQGFIDAAVCEAAWLARQHSASDAHGHLSAGAAFMHEELLRGKMKNEIDEWISDKCAELLELLPPVATESCERRLLPKENEGSNREMVANWAFLLPTKNLDDFRSRVERISGKYADQGLTFITSGPWPPYSFCPALSDDTDDEGAELQGNDK